MAKQRFFRTGTRPDYTAIATRMALPRTPQRERPYNLKRVLNLVSFEKLMAAMA